MIKFHERQKKKTISNCIITSRSICMICNVIVQDLQEFIDNAEHGVIYFNLGSVVRMEDIPIEIQNGIKNGFAELPQKVLWKKESDRPVINLPKNVKTRKWYPQYDITSEISLFY